MAKKKKLIGVGWSQVGSYRRYTVGYPHDSEGRCTWVKIAPEDLPDLNIGSHPSIGKVEKFFNTQDGLDLINSTQEYNVVQVGDYFKVDATVEHFVKFNLCNWKDCEFNKEHENFLQNKCTNNNVDIDTCPSAKDTWEEAIKNGYVDEVGEIAMKSIVTNKVIMRMRINRDVEEE